MIRHAGCQMALIPVLPYWYDEDGEIHFFFMWLLVGRRT